MFIESSSDIVRPFTKMTKKNILLWNALYKVSFNTIKIALTNRPILIFPEYSEPYVLYADTSKHSWSGVLTQGDLQR